MIEGKTETRKNEKMQRKIEIDSKGEGEKKLNEVCNLHEFSCDRFEIEKESREKRGENENKNRFKNRQDLQILLQSSSKWKNRRVRRRLIAYCIESIRDQGKIEMKTERREKGVESWMERRRGWRVVLESDGSGVRREGARD